MSPDIGIWLGALFTLAIYSFLYSENPAYFLAEHVFLGLAAAHLMVQGYYNVVNQAWNPLIERGELIWLAAIGGGLLLLTRWFKSVRWLSRIPLGFMMGIAAALSVKRAISSEFFRQLQSTATMQWDTPTNAVFILTVLFTLSYFIFGINDRTRFGGVVRQAGVVGQYMMMIAFGASLGATVMARLSLVIARLQYLFGDWLGMLN